eukprot:TRINITY_DN12035_c0_g1_i7.p1 TRINITY_DN12035_c0_g1~~TRINITY_DN12035_c0_g1_i7.p1  ORF type:complete len:112 (-),score=20.49 TRINITY_DN12035_c0_g1_i7:25-360(-)
MEEKILIVLLYIVFYASANDNIVKNLNEEIEHAEELISLYAEKAKQLRKLRDYHLKLNNITENKTINTRMARNSSANLINLISHTIKKLSLIHICRCRRYAVCRSRWSPYH